MFEIFTHFITVCIPLVMFDALLVRLISRPERFRIVSFSNFLGFFKFSFKSNVVAKIDVFGIFPSGMSISILLKEINQMLFCVLQNNPSKNTPHESSKYESSHRRITVNPTKDLAKISLNLRSMKITLENLKRDKKKCI